MVVLDRQEHTDEVYALSDVMVLVDGNIRYQGNDEEIQIRQKIIDLMQGKEVLREITVDDFDFVRVCNKKVRKPDGNVPFDALGVNTVYPTGAISSIGVGGTSTLSKSFSNTKNQQNLNKKSE